jgi:long-chain acyl-CoA synthetase
MEYQSVFELLRAVVEKNGDRPAYRFKRGGTWHDVSWNEHLAMVRAVAKALMALGVKKGDRVNILGQTRLEWVQSDFGIGACGGVTVGIYPSSLGPECAYIANHCDAEVLFVENQEQLEKMLQVRAETPAIKHVVRWDGPGDPASDVLGWQEFLEKGTAISDDELDQRAAAIRPDDLASLVYTSGTTGVPKGVMLTHDNLLFTGGSVGESLYHEPHFVTLLFLPLAHVFARLIAFVALYAGLTLAFAESIQAVGENLKEVKPHFIASVPRVYEKVFGKITSGVEEAGGLKEKLFNWAVGVGRQVSVLQQAHKPVTGLLKLKHALADKLVLQKIQAAMGGRLVYAISGAAPLNKEIAEFFHACGVLILEGIGMTENTSFSNVNRINNNKFGTVGQPGPGVEQKIAEDGEVLFRGRNVMKGYFKNDEATAETIDSDGWLFTGDIGEIDAEGFLKITDRKKDLIVTAGGKNVAPQRIERIMRTSHFISQVVAIGDKRKFISALVTLDPETLPGWAEKKEIAYGDLAELADNPEVIKLIGGEIEERNRQLASFETVKTFRILPRDLTIETGDMTPSLKIKRKVVLKKYADLVEQLYADSDKEVTAPNQR